MNHLNILIIEDDGNDYELLCLSLKAFQATFFRAETFSEAQRAMQRTKFRLVFLDLKVPGSSTDPVSLIRWIKERFPMTPIIVLTGDCEFQRNTRKRATLFDAGALIVVPKPFTSQDNQAILNLLDLTFAVYRNGMIKYSWRTTVLGIMLMGMATFLYFEGKLAEAIGFAIAGCSALVTQDAKALKSVSEMVKKKG